MTARKFLIVGQGIAGSLLAHALLERQQAVVIVDDFHRCSSSMMSAGIINPITGKRFAVMPQFDMFYQNALTCYDNFSRRYKQSFFISKPIIRIFNNVEEQRHFFTKPDNERYLIQVNEPGYYHNGLIDPWGSVVISSGGYCLTTALLEFMRDDFKHQGCLREELFQQDDLKMIANGVQWKGERFDAVIFAQGYHVMANPWFKDLPFHHVKGELLRFHAPDQHWPDAIITQGKWCLPLGNGVFMAGATYDRDVLDYEATPQGLSEIMSSIEGMLKGEKTISQHQAAIRPALIDQKPVIGWHAQHPCIGIFNGFGSKGFLLAPWYALEFAAQIVDGKPLADDVNVNRF